ncbi:hypothetical protein [Dyella japonica]|uniref:Uncharacterized protein n=1 Tax=Dyella japonica TaxID=231455 RepID=A0ABV2K2C2_9GAMM
MYVGGSTPTSRNPNQLAALRGESHSALSATESELQYEVLTDKNLSPGGARLAKRIDMAKYKAFLAERDKADQQLRQLLQRMDAACANHDAWLATAEAAHAEESHAIAAALTAYDRDHIIAAQGLEQSIALLMHGMGYPLPGRHDKDPRFARLQTWVTNANSPLAMAVAAYNPFKDRADAVGNLIGATDVLIEELHGRFPAKTNATDLITQDVSTAVLKKMNGKTRWDANKTLRQQVAAAAKDAEAEKVIGLLNARYGITRKIPAPNTPEAKFTDEVQAFIRSGMAEVKKSSTIEVVGTRTVTVLETTTTRVVPSIKSLGVTTGGGAFNVLMLHYNLINLQSAWNDLQTTPDTQRKANFGSAIFGIMAAIAATAVSARTLYIAAAARMAVNLSGASFGVGIAGFLASKLFARSLGYPGILLAVAADVIKGNKQSDAGNEEVGAYTRRGGIAIGVGSAFMLEGGIALGTAMSTVFGAAAAEATVPVVGWLGAVVTILVGMAVVGVGVWLQSRAAEQKHSPLELWAARSLFGTRQNDGEDHAGISLDAQKRLPGYSGPRDEVQGWYEGYFAPLALDADQAKSIGLPGITTDWHGHWLDADTVEFAVLLPGFVLGQSTWSGGLSSVGTTVPGALRPVIVYANKPTCHVTPQGLVLHVRRTINSGDEKNMAFYLTYFPNQGFDPGAKVEASIELIG